jgi:hypothetical protein
MTWTHNGVEFTSELAEGYFGFVYLITHTLTGRMYVGKKFFTKSKTKQVKGKKKKIRVESDWADYYGSNEQLLNEVKGKESEYTREILHLCKSRSECAYWETWQIFNRHALLSEQYYNQWVSCKIRKNHLSLKADVGAVKLDV